MRPSLHAPSRSRQPNCPLGPSDRSAPPSVLSTCTTVAVKVIHGAGFALASPARLTALNASFHSPVQSEDDCARAAAANGKVPNNKTSAGFNARRSARVVDCEKVRLPSAVAVSLMVLEA